MLRKRILIVHNVENIRIIRRSTIDFIYAFERYAPENDYVYHRIQLPVTEVLRDTAWDAVIFDSTALGVVTIRPRERFQRLREEWSFLRNHPAVKIAFPQDDASHSALYDYWLHWMKTDVVFTVRPEKIERLYPLTRQSALFISTVAGFIDDKAADGLAAMARPWRERAYVIGQRVTRYPAWGGRFAQRKSDIVIRLGEECARRGLSSNVSTDPGDVFHGDEWFAFLGDCRFVAGAEGGHGLCDPYGAIQDAVNDFVGRHPEASFEEIEQACFEGLDGQELFPGFAPRVLEAALMGCGQILLEGRYRGFVRPGEHYIEVRDDYSNLDDVFAQMGNTEHVLQMIANCSRDLVDSPAFRFSTLVSEVFAQVELRHRAPDPSNAVDQSAQDIRRQHFSELRDALAIIGIERERLYEPYLTAWIMRELSGQVRHAEEARQLGIRLPDQEEPVAPGTAKATGTAAFSHVCTVIASLPPEAIEMPRLLAAVRSSIGEREILDSGQLREILALAGLTGKLEALVEALQQEAPTAVAEAMGWPVSLRNAIQILQETGLGQDHPNGPHVQRVLRRLAQDGLQSAIIKALARRGEP